MSSRPSTDWSSIGRKILMSLTGLILLSFVTFHMAGNLPLLKGVPDDYNAYAHLLTGLKALLIAAEAMLAACLLVHVWAAVRLLINKWRARPVKYKVYKSAGRESRKGVGASTMIYTGFLIFIFVALHLKTFKYGPMYTVTVDGVEMRDLHRLVVEVFSDGWIVLGYVVSMVILGFHLSHAVWSAFQSLGIWHLRYTPVIYRLGRVLAFLVAVGFMVPPVWIYFTGGIVQ